MIIDIGKVRFDLADELAWECAKCGNCCRRQPADLNEKEIERIEGAGYSDFYTETKTFSLLKFGKNGCVFLTDDNLCEIYDIRPQSCRGQPFLPVEYDLREKKIIAILPHQLFSGCEGIHKGEMDKENLIEVAESIEKLFEELKKFVSRVNNLPPNSIRNIRKVNRICRKSVLE